MFLKVTASFGNEDIVSFAAAAEKSVGLSKEAAVGEFLAWKELEASGNSIAFEVEASNALVSRAEDCKGLVVARVPGAEDTAMFGGVDGRAEAIA